MVSDFQRESLEPSSTYQVASTAAPILYTRKTQAPPTDSFTFRTDKRPIKNILTNALTKPLKPMLNGIGDGAGNGSVNTIEKSTNGTNSTHTNGTDSDNGDIKTAPSYTFYASRKILERSGFVLHTSRDVLEYLQGWLNVAYPLAKLGKLF